MGEERITSTGWLIKGGNRPVINIEGGVAMNPKKAQEAKKRAKYRRQKRFTQGQKGSLRLEVQEQNGTGKEDYQ